LYILNWATKFLVDALAARQEAMVKQLRESTGTSTSASL